MSTSTIINTHERTQVVIEHFAEHVEFCGEPFKEDILKKVLELKSKDYKILTTYVMPNCLDANSSVGRRAEVR